MRELTVNEIARLEERGCQAEDWTEILVDDDFSPSQMECVALYGHVEIGSLNGTIEMEEGFRRRCGVRNAVLRNTRIGDECLIENVRGHIANCLIGDRCLVADIGVITNQEGGGFEGSIPVAVLNEGGDPNVIISEHLTAQLAWLMVNYPATKRLVETQTEAANADEPHIGSGSRVVGVREMTNVRLGEGCEVRGSARLSNCSVMSTDEANTFIGSDVIIEDSVVAAGASVVDGAKIYRSFVGETAHIGRGFTAESSLFFANCHMDNGESCAAFCGPFSASHHKSTLLIGGAYSFYNAGSATNGSNHAYKMGPVHWGALARGSKTASGSHILWPAQVGSFSVVLGKVQNHPDTRPFPLSYVIGDGMRTHLVPGINIRTVGTWRDINKWPKRDARPWDSRNDLINFAFPNPYIIQSVVEGRAILLQLLRSNPEDTSTFTYHGCDISRQALLKGIQYYELAIRLFLRRALDGDNTSDASDTAGEGRWVDMMGMLAPQVEIESVTRDISSGAIASAATLREVLRQIHDSYPRHERAYAAALLTRLGTELFTDPTQWRTEADAAHALWLQMIKDDAEKEFQLGDVEPEQLRDFLLSVK